MCTKNIMLQLSNRPIPHNSKAFREIEQSIERVATTNSDCIIFGESGMRKEQILIIFSHYTKSIVIVFLFADCAISAV